MESDFVKASSSRTEENSLLSQAMHMAVIGAVWMTVLTHLQLKDEGAFE